MCNCDKARKMSQGQTESLVDKAITIFKCMIWELSHHDPFIKRPRVEKLDVLLLPPLQQGRENNAAPRDGWTSETTEPDLLDQLLPHCQWGKSAEVCKKK